MSQSDSPFSLLDEAAIAAAELHRDPYDFAFVEQAVSPRFKDEVLADAPQIPNRGSYGLPSLRYGPQFGAVVEDLLSPRFRRLFEKQFGPGSTLGNNLLDHRSQSRRLIRLFPPYTGGVNGPPVFRRKQTCSSIIHSPTVPNPSTLRLSVPPRI